MKQSIDPIFFQQDIPVYTLPKFNIAPEKWWLEDVFPTEIVPF